MTSATAVRADPRPANLVRACARDIVDAGLRHILPRTEHTDLVQAVANMLYEAGADAAIVRKHGQDALGVARDCLKKG